MPAPSVHLKIKMAGKTRYITTISRKNRGREQSMKRNSVPMVDTVELGTFYLLFILFLQQSQDSDSNFFFCNFFVTLNFVVKVL